MAQWTQFPNIPSTTSNQFISQTFHLSRQQLFTSALGQLGKEEEHLLPSTPWEPSGTVFPAYLAEGWPNPATFDNFNIKQTFKEICQMETWRRNNDCIKNHARIGPISYETRHFHHFGISIFSCVRIDKIVCQLLKYMYLHICTYIR